MISEQPESKSHARMVTMGDCHGCPAINRSIFSLVAGPDRAELIKTFRLLSFPAGAQVYHQGGRDPYLYIVRSGIARMTKVGPSGTERIVRLLRAGDTAGIGLMLGETYRHTLTAMTRLDTCRMPVDTVRAKVRQDPELAAKLFQLWQDGLDNAEMFLTEFSTGTAEQRVARLMLYLVSSDLGTVCHLPSRDDMGEMLGLTAETVSRVTADFKRRRFLASDREHCCEVIDAVKLEEIAHGISRRNHS